MEGMQIFSTPYSAVLAMKDTINDDNIMSILDCVDENI
jgi:hypothetical protein